MLEPPSWRASWNLKTAAPSSDCSLNVDSDVPFIQSIYESMLFQNWPSTGGPYSPGNTQSHLSGPLQPTSSMLMTRVQRDQQQGKPAKFITYSCPNPPNLSDQILSDQMDETLDESNSVASSRESRVWRNNSIFFEILVTIISSLALENLHAYLKLWNIWQK